MSLGGDGDKLGLPGRAHEHREQMTAAWASVDASKSGNRVAFLAIAISLAGLIVSALSYLVAKEAVDSGRRSHLLDRRIQACASLQAIADNMLSQAIGMADDVNRPSAQSRVRREQVFQSFLEFEHERVLYMLGPNSLATAEGELAMALFDADDATWRPPTSPQKLRDKVYAADAELREFRTACVDAVGAYREGPIPFPEQRRPGPN